MPADVLLDIAQCLDYGTLVALCHTHHSFFVVVQSKAHALAKRRRWDVYVYENAVGLVAADDKRTAWCDWRGIEKVKWHFKPNNLLSCLDAMTRMAAYLGFYMLSEMYAPIEMPIDRILLRAPALRFVEKLHLEPIRRCKSSVFSIDPENVPVAKDVEQFVSGFASLQHVSLSLGSRFDWGTFLRSESTLKLTSLLIGYRSTPEEDNILSYCLDFSHLPADAARLLEFHGSFSSDFLVECVTRFAKLKQKVVLKRVLEEGSRPDLSSDDFDAESLRDDPARNRPSFTRYSSRHSSMFAFVQAGNWAPSYRH
ncbi:hypothetical protein AAVH_25341 [Aphelenchoides avenae]|nr:hypothetical protein AAVH_25341 [Aphelenchus avenae]